MKNDFYDNNRKVDYTLKVKVTRGPEDKNNLP